MYGERRSVPIRMHVCMGRLPGNMGLYLPNLWWANPSLGLVGEAKTDGRKYVCRTCVKAVVDVHVRFHTSVDRWAASLMSFVGRIYNPSVVKTATPTDKAVRARVDGVLQTASFCETKSGAGD